MGTYNVSTTDNPTLYNYEDWFYDAVQAADGGYVAVGFTEIYYNGNHYKQPVIAMFDNI
ncbi:MAG: hypothetical protein LH473_11305 [Chitinophagales bacterium]|nr:hypothetical protein [Chitinophagales bacterium]